MLHQQFRYEYPGPIERLRHRLVVAPPEAYGDQLRVDHELRVSPGLNVAWERDSFGNLVAMISARQVEAEIQLDYTATIRRGDGPRLGPAWYDEARYWLPSALTRPSLAMRDAAERLMAQDDRCQSVRPADRGLPRFRARDDRAVPAVRHPGALRLRSPARRRRNACMARGDRARAGERYRRGRALRSDARAPRKSRLRLRRRRARLRGRRTDLRKLRRPVSRPLHDDPPRRRPRPRIRGLSGACRCTWWPSRAESRPRSSPSLRHRATRRASRRRRRPHPRRPVRPRDPERYGSGSTRTRRSCRRERTGRGSRRPRRPASPRATRSRR